MLGQEKGNPCRTPKGEGTNQPTPRGLERMSFFGFSSVTRLVVGLVFACGEVFMVIFNMVHNMGII